MKSYISLLVLLVFTMSSLAINPAILQIKNKVSTETNWVPVYSYHSEYNKLFVDTNSIDRVEVKDNEITSTSILVVQNQDNYVEVRDTNKIKKVLFKSMLVFVAVDCKHKTMMNIINLYFSINMPLSSTVPISVYEYPTTKDSVIQLGRDNFLYKILCNTST